MLPIFRLFMLSHKVVFSSCDYSTIGNLRIRAREFESRHLNIFIWILSLQMYVSNNDHKARLFHQYSEIFNNDFYKKMGLSRPLFGLFSSFPHNNFNNTNWIKHRWCAWSSNPWPPDGRRTWLHGAMAAAHNKENLPNDFCQNRFVNC